MCREKPHPPRLLVAVKSVLREELRPVELQQEELQREEREQEEVKAKIPPERLLPEKRLPKPGKEELWRNGLWLRSQEIQEMQSDPLYCPRYSLLQEEEAIRKRENTAPRTSRFLRSRWRFRKVRIRERNRSILSKARLKSFLLEDWTRSA